MNLRAFEETKDQSEHTIKIIHNYSINKIELNQYIKLKSQYINHKHMSQSIILLLSNTKYTTIYMNITAIEKRKDQREPRSFNRKPCAFCMIFAAGRVVCARSR
jgi:hypothetical protein